MFKSKSLLLLLFVTVAFSQNQLPLIPKPVSVAVQKGSFTLSESTKIILNDLEFRKETDLFNQFLKANYGFELQVLDNSKSSVNIIKIQRSNAGNPSMEAYQLEVSPTGIQLASKGNTGIFYAFQTLMQLLPIQKRPLQIPSVKIDDEPKYQWRGMHLDVGRHFFPTAFIKKYIDYMAMYKMNTFHWHLTEDQGWRIEIKKYPKLTEIGAWRKGSMVGHYNDQAFDDKPYGGFYTQEEIKEIVAYAKERHITIVPEIEMPGHSQAALAAYPELSCTGGPFEVAQKWGVLEDIYCPKEETFEFLENVLTEVIDLFPSEYIHIGGDESPKARWKNCPHCQALIKREGLKDEHELQSYFIKRIEKFINAKGRKIIGWDEILEGGLAPNAAVMSWRGTEGGISAAKQHHYVVMTPGSHCYFDHYQGEPKNEPLAIGGYTTVEKVYSYQPVPQELSPAESKYILGAQGNVWTEYMNTPEHVEYMIMPRMAALAEVVWGTSSSSVNGYKNFQDRLVQHFALLDKMGVHYSKAIFEVTTQVKPEKNRNGVLFELISAKNSNTIRYTVDGSNPTAHSLLYKKPIKVSGTQTVKAAYFEKEIQKSTTIEQDFFWSKAVGKKITLVNEPHENYSNGGAFTLVDGIIGNKSKFGRGWLGFSGKDLNAIIDLGKVETINKVIIGVLESKGSWIYYPKNIEVLVSNDGKNFKSVQQLSSDEIKDVKGQVVLEVNSQKAKFVKVIATNFGKIPDGMAGAGSDAWLFVDEIGVE